MRRISAVAWPHTLLNTALTCVTALGAAAALTGCGEAVVTGPNTCAAANEHLAACLGQPAQPASGTCDEAQATRILDSDCAALTASVGKGDAWWCTPFSGPWVIGCGGDDSTGENPGDSTGTGAITGSVDYSWDSLGSQVSSMSCALVVLTDAEGDEVARTHTNVHGGYAFDTELTTGEYTVTLYDRHGEDEHNVPFTVGQQPATRTVAVRGGETTDADFLLSYFRDGTAPLFNEPGLTTEDDVSRCATVRHTFSVTDQCGDGLLPYLAINRDWVITLTALDGTVTYSTPMCQPADGDHWAWDGCNGSEEDVILNTFSQVLPGQYQVGFIRVDLPDKNNLDLADELKWRSHEVLDETIVFEFGERPDEPTLNLDPLLTEPMVLLDPTAECE